MTTLTTAGVRAYFDAEARKGRRLLPDPETASGLGQLRQVPPGDDADGRAGHARGARRRVQRGLDRDALSPGASRMRARHVHRRGRHLTRVHRTGQHLESSELRVPGLRRYDAAVPGRKLRPGDRHRGHRACRRQARPDRRDLARAAARRPRVSDDAESAVLGAARGTVARTHGAVVRAASRVREGRVHRLVRSFAAVVVHGIHARRSRIAGHLAAPVRVVVRMGRAAAAAAARAREISARVPCHAGPPLAARDRRPPPWLDDESSVGEAGVARRDRRAETRA